MLRADLHVHTWHSGYNHDLPFLKSRDCFADPLAVYQAAKARGMDLVAITDHDSIDGGLELLSRAPDGRDVILGEEVSCWLPVDGATGPDQRVEVHFGTWGMTETAHRELQPLRGNALEVAAYLRAAGIFFAFNHPFHFYQGQLPLERYLELLIDAAPAIETRNGAMLPAHNQLAAALARVPRQGRRRRQRRAHAAPRRHDLDGGARRDARRVPGQRRRGARPRRRRPRRHVPARRRHLRRHRAGTWLSLVGLRRHEISVPRRILGASFSLVDAAGRVRAADRRRPLEAARSAVGRVLGGGARRRVHGSRAAAGRDRAGARIVSASGSDRRVAITGIGIVSSLGAGREANWEHMVAGLCGLRPVTLFDVSAFRSQIAGEIDTFDLQARFTPYQRRRWSRSEQLGVVAATEAFEDAGLLDGQLDRTRVGVLLGAGTGDLLRNEEYYFAAADRRASTGPGRPGSTITSRTRRSTCWRSTSTCRGRARASSRRARRARSRSARPPT